MSENDAVSHTKPPQPSAQLTRPTLTLPTRPGFESLLSGSSFGLSPGPMTLVSNFFSDHDPDSDFRSFSQLLAGAMSSPRPEVEPVDGRFNMNRVPGSGDVGNGFSMFSTGFDSPNVFGGQGPFGMSHKEALAQVTAHAVQAQPSLHLQPGLHSALGFDISASASFPGFNSVSSVQHNMISSAPKSREIKEHPHFSGSDQRSQSSSIVVDKPADDGYNWRKYGQKQVKGSEFPRSYYKCTHPSCPVRKKVERSLDGQVIEIIYKGQHNHDAPQKRSKDGGNIIQDMGTQGNPEFSEHTRGGRDQESSLATEEHLSSDEEEVGDDGTIESGGYNDEPDAKRRNMDVRVSEQAASHRTVAEPKIIFQTTSEVDLLDDGYRWRKYGQKVVKGNPYPRSYYKCTYAGCNVRKHVERAATDPKAVVTTYEGKHDHDVPAARTSSHNTANNSAAPTRPYSSGGNNNTYVGETAFTLNKQPVALLRLKDERLT
ncbi:hypothetical protein vseg_002016 [Gypsophila vaccaria]